MPRPILFSLILFLTTVVLGWLFIFSRGQGGLSHSWTYVHTGATETPYALLEEKKRSQAATDMALYNSAIESRDTAVCEKIVDVTQKSQCHDMVGATKALESKDRTACKTLSNTGMQDRCEDTVVYALAESGNDPALCDDLHDENIRANCTKNFQRETVENAIASGTLTTHMCADLTDGTLQSQCQDRLRNDEDIALYKKAIDLSSLDVCDMIHDEKLRNKCRDTLLLDKALTDGDIEICASISDAERANYCQKSLLSRSDISKYQEYIASDDLEGCAKLTLIPMQNQCHDTIIFSRVRATQDISLCDTLYNTGITSRCQAMVRK